MRALSIRQPWVHAILHFGKRVENRSWEEGSGNLAAARRLIGHDILIHASNGVGTLGDFDSAVEAMLDAANLEGQEARDALHCGGVADEMRRGWVPALALPRGAIVARARLVDVARTMLGGHRIVTGLAISARTWRCLLCDEASAERICDGECPKADPWAVPGVLGLILADVVPLAAPVPFKGALGFFEAPDGILPAEVRP